MVRNTFKNFHNNFVKALAAEEITTEVFLDDSDKTKYGDVRKFLRERASMADFLIVFVGHHYRRRQYCLFEWQAFRSQFGEENEAKDRLCIIEIDNGAITKLIEKAEDQNEIERALIIESTFQQKLVRDKERILSEMKGKPSEEFAEAVKKIAAEFSERYRKIQNRKPPKRVDPLPGPIERPPDPREKARIDVVIAAVTPDLEAAVTHLTAELDGYGRKTRRINGSAADLTDSELRFELQSANWLVQPFSWHRVTNANALGGHLIRQVSLFDRPERALFWRPEDALGRDDPREEWVAKVEKRPEHVGTLLELHAGRSPGPSRYPIIFGSPAKVIERIVPPSEPQSRNGPAARIVWESDQKIADRLALAAEFTEERCAELSAEKRANFRVRNIPFELQELLKKPAEWLRDAHGLVLTDYAKTLSELRGYIDEVYEAIDDAGRPIPLIVGVVDPGKTAKWAGPPTIVFTIQDEPKKALVQGELLEKFDGFLRKAHEMARGSAIPSGV